MVTPHREAAITTMHSFRKRLSVGFVLDVRNANTYDLPLPRMLYQASA